MKNAVRMMNGRDGNGLPLPLAGEGWGGGTTLPNNARTPPPGELRSPTFPASGRGKKARA